MGPRYHRGHLLIATGAMGLGAGLVSATILLSVRHPAPKESELVELAAAAGYVRPFRLRLSGSIEHADCSPATLSTSIRCHTRERLEPTWYRTWSTYGSRLRRRLEGDKSVEVLHDLGIWYLLSGHDGLEGAFEALQEANQLSKKSDPSLLNDLAIAYLLKAENGLTSMRIRALEAIEQAWHLDPTRPDVLFNRGLILERLSLRVEARRSWLSFLGHERAAGWLAEVEEHLARLEDRQIEARWEAAKASLHSALLGGDVERAAGIIRTFPWRAYRYIESEFLSGWAESIERAEHESAGTQYRALHLAARVLERITGDALLYDTVTAIKAAGGDSNSEAAQRFAAAIRLYSEGREQYDATRNYDAARPRFESSAESLRLLGSPYWLWPAYYRSLCTYFGHSATAGEASLLQLVELIHEKPYPEIRGFVHWMLGFARYDRAELDASSDAYHEALNDFTAVSDLESLAAIHTQLSLNNLRANDREGAWQHRLTALGSLPWIRTPRRVSTLFQALTEGAAADGLYAAALVFQRRFDSVSSMDPILSANAWRRRAELAHSAGLSKEALHALEEGWSAVQGIEGTRDRAILEGQILSLEGKVLGVTDPGAALRSAELAADRFEFTQKPLELMQVRHRIGLILQEIGETSRAARALESALAIGIAIDIDSDHRRAYFKQAQAILDDVIALRVREGDASIGFRDNETAQLMAIGSAFGGEFSELSALVPLDQAAVSDLLPPATTLVSYRFSGGGLFIWTTRRGSIKATELSVDEETLTVAVEGLLTALSREATQAELSAELATLYRWLVEPIRAELDDAHSLLIQPDRVLWRLPFDALVDGQGRYLVETHGVAMVPSATLAVSFRDWNECLRNPDTNPVLAVGDPAFDPEDHPGLERLRFAAAEANEVGRLYSGNVLVGEEATRERLLPLLDQARIFHFAGHALHRPDRPNTSTLVLAADSDRHGAAALTSADIANRRLQNTCLAILSACDTGAGSTLEREGNHNLASAFVLAGVPVVVSSFWPVVDRQASELLIDFHRRLGVGVGALTALTDAKRAALRNAEALRSSPASWAAYQVLVGSLTKYSSI